MDQRPTIGVLVSWPVYYGTSILRYLHTVLHGISIAAVAHDCNLLLACGMDEIPAPHAALPAWPTLTSDSTFVPVGPWNTDALIVVAMYLTTAQEHYLQGVAAAGHPIVYTGFEGPGLSVHIDNRDGVRQGFEHLRAHGHECIAFIAGLQPPTGESRPRLEAYLDATRALGRDPDPRLIAYGGLTVDGGRRAMRELLTRGTPFTAVLGSNDDSCFGATEALHACGLRVPEDIALIGFDDLLEARAHVPPLTTVHNPVFTMGQQAVHTILDVLAGHPPATAALQLPVRLVIRRSCGCPAGVDRVADPAHRLPAADARIALERAMAEAVLLEARSGPDAVEALCHDLSATFVASIQSTDGAAFERALLAVVQRVETLDDDVHNWHRALGVLGRELADLYHPLPAATRLFAVELLNRAHQLVSEQARHQAARAVRRKENLAGKLGPMTAQLLLTLDTAQIPTILAEHLPHLDITQLLAARFVPCDDDPVAQWELLLSYGVSRAVSGQRFRTRQFPPLELYPPDRAFQLALLPLVAQEGGQGFVVFDAADLEPCAAIVRHLAAALRSSRLYVEAQHGRQQAEEANRLKSRFLSMVSHELRTPLNLIVGLSELLLRDQSPTPAVSSTARGDLERIYTSAQHLGQLIGDVLDLASSEAAQLHLIREPLDLAEVLRPVVLTGAHLAREQGLAWEARLPQAGPWVLGDRTRLRQVVLNLISNAVKFTPRGTVTVALSVEDSTVTVAVTDTGLGVPVGEQARIFDEFQRAERTAARGYGGLGLGLAICKQLVALHGGTIGVRSTGEEGCGATFFFTLPTMVMVEVPTVPDLTPAAPVRERPVVFLTGPAETGPSLQSYLADRGLTTDVRRVDVETDWLPRLLAAPPAVILLDAHLALEQGWQILGVLQRHPETAAIPLVVCSLDPRNQHGALLELNYQHKPLDAVHLGQILASQGLLANDALDLKTVLVVDDDPAMLDVHTRLLQQHGTHFRVLQAHHGREALAVLQATRPDLVLLDLMMPELDGFGVLEAMRAMERTRDVPVVVLTAQILSEAEMERLNRGVAAVLSKGLFSGKEILAHVESALAQTHKRSSTAQRLVRKALVYLHAHSAQPLSREELARYVGITEDYLTTCFHEELGISPITYLRRYRVQQARRLLEEGQLSVTEVALAVGFGDSAYFSRVFQREVGITPSAYRRGQRVPV